MIYETTMFEIGNTMISIDVVEKKFSCDLNLCKGICCVEGKSGAPIDKDEQMTIEEVYPIVRDYMTFEGIEAVEEQGWYVYDDEGDCVTPLVSQGQCAYSCPDANGVAMCAFEKAFNDKKTDFRKPVSCHLYPVRITSYKDYDAINYESLKICAGACKKGMEEDVPLYIFLKEPLARKYGNEWYNLLELTAKEYLGIKN